MFIGQEHILKELSVILPAKENFNLLLIGNPGQGKTLLGFKIANFLNKTFLYKIADNKDEFFSRIEYESQKHRLIFIDEIHRLGYEVERIYPIIDAKQNFFIFATNQPQLLPEAFRTRVIELLFARYSQEELREIVSSYMPIRLNNELLDIIIEAAEGNPRRISQYCVRITSILRQTGRQTLTINSLIEIISDYFNIINGMTSLEREYLELLERIKTASLQTLVSSLGVSKETLQTEIEPQLLFKGKIKITSKGREYVNTL
jgi:Holliday junction resolvasome RuvABC ATP-dependent DNA helicase subunit